jgi:hypothetical protein
LASLPSVLLFDLLPMNIPHNLLTKITKQWRVTNLRTDRKAHDDASICDLHWFPAHHVGIKANHSWMHHHCEILSSKTKNKHRQKQSTSHNFQKVDLMNLWQPSLEEVDRYMSEPPPPSQDAPVIIKEEPMPIFPSRAELSPSSMASFVS